MNLQLSSGYMNACCKQLLLLACLGVFAVCLAQSGRVKDASGAAVSGGNKATEAKPLIDPNDTRTAAALFEDADNYTRNKFDAFEKLKMPYDQQIEQKISREQRDLAASYAKLLTARKLEGPDVYYLGLLYNLARDFEPAYETMRRFLNENPNATGEPAQNARAIVVIQAAKKGLLPEAESRLAEYVKSEPQVAEDRYSLENWVATAYFKTRDYAHALPHAQQMWSAAKLAASKKSTFQRDAMLNDAVGLLAEIDLKLDKKRDAVDAIQELRRLALAFPSGNLQKLGLRRLIQIDPGIDPFKSITEAPPSAPTPPEITASEWLDQQPTKLSDLRGRVVLLDFWAPWCGPCRETFPRLQKWHENYKNKGLVILGLTTFEGEVEGKHLTHTQELDYLRDFKKKFHLPYGFAISDSENNDTNYAVSSIPTTFLIDRRGIVRFISVGSSDLESAALNRMIKKLIEEPAPTASVATR